jgi:outer membrane protein TolC
MSTSYSWAALAVALLAAPADAAPLTLDHALELAVQRSEAARAARAEVSGAQESARAAGQLPDPMLSVGLENLPVQGPDRFSTTADSMTMKRIGISQEWVSRDKRSLREAAAQALVARQAVKERAAEAETRLQTALAYVDAYYAGEALRLTRLIEHQAGEELEAAKARLASATAGSQEVLALSGAQGVAEDDSAEEAQAQAKAAVALQRWVGVAADELDAPGIPPAPSEQAYVAGRPEVLAAQRDMELAHEEAAVTASERKPNWTWMLAYGQRTGLPDMATFEVNIPLTVSPAERQDRLTAAKLAQAAKAESELEEASRAASAEYRGLASDAERLARRIERYRAAVLVSAQQRAAAALAGYRSDQVSLATLFEARRVEVDARRKLLALERELARTRAQLAYTPLIRGDQP